MTSKKQKLTKREVTKYAKQVKSCIDIYAEKPEVGINVIIDIPDFEDAINRLTDGLLQLFPHHEARRESTCFTLWRTICEIKRTITVNFINRKDISGKIHGISESMDATVLVNISKEGEVNVLHDEKTTLISWVNKCLTTCVKERYPFAIIVIPPNLALDDITGQCKNNSIWSIDIYDESVELSNESKGYTVSIMTAKELESMIDNDSSKVDMCFTHFSHANCVKMWAEQITFKEEPIPVEPVELPPPVDPELIVDEGQRYEQILEPKAISHSRDNLLPVDNLDKYPSIPDSGNVPRVFDSGFKRDSDIGKAKWSLLPPFTWKMLIPNKTGEGIAFFLLTGKVSNLEAALSNMVQEHNVKLMCDRYYGGAEKYGYFNWAQLGPLSSYMDSVGRHLWAMSTWGTTPGDPESEDDHIGAVMWGLSCMVHLVTLVKDGHASKDLLDIPAYLNLVR